jgi:uncharacterized protein YqeY
VAEAQSVLQLRLNKDTEAALRSGDKNLLHTLRLVRAEIQRQEKDKQVLLQDSDVTQLLRRMVKQRKESLELYEKGGRNDLARQESTEIEIIARYLPAQMSEAQLADVLKKAINAVNAQGMSDMGKVIKHTKELMPDADMGAVSAKARQLLT